MDAELAPLRKQTPDAPHGTASGSGIGGHPCRPLRKRNGGAVVGDGAPARWRLKGRPVDARSWHSVQRERRAGIGPVWPPILPGRLPVARSLTTLRGRLASSTATRWKSTERAYGCGNRRAGEQPALSRRGQLAVSMRCEGGERPGCVHRRQAGELLADLAGPIRSHSGDVLGRRHRPRGLAHARWSRFVTSGWPSTETRLRR
jgi:hypothetical protein